MSAHPTNPGLVLLAAAARSAGVGGGVYEYRFAYPRRFRFDLAYPVYMVALEREGSTWQGGRHTTGKGYRDDVRKYNLAAIAGWCVVRATADMIASGEAATDLLAALRAAAKRWTGPAADTPPRVVRRH